jgi:spermidine/putrescine transport system substrate-binding protein
MSKKTPSYLINRRKILKGGIALSAAAAGPWVISPKALASSGEVNVLMWSDYLPEGYLADFESKTGIKVNYTGIGSNEEIINKMKATKGAGIDICSPTNMRSGQWVDLELLQAWDKSKISTLDNVNPTMLKVGDTEWNFGDKGSHWLPQIWGTEGIAWRTDLWAPADGVPSYGDVWSEENKGKTMIRAHSGMLGAGLHMENIGELEPGDMWKAYDDEDEMRRVWSKVTDWCISKKSYLKLIWNDADTQKNGLLNDGVVCGQTWDGPPLALKSQGEPVTYQAPKEGSLAWVDGMSLSAASENLDQVYEFVNFAFDPVPAGKAIDDHGYNSAVLGADQNAADQYKKNFSEAYPGDALSNLHPWPTEPQWYADVRTEFEEKFKSA